MQANEKNIEWYRTRFEAFEQSLNGEKTTALHALRQDAIQAFVREGFPTARQEEWRFTNIQPITKVEFRPVLQYDSRGVTRKKIEPYLLEKAIHMVFINGVYSAELSDAGSNANGVVIGSLAGIQDTALPYLIRSAERRENAFTALNTAFLRDGCFISLPKDIIFDQVIQLLFVATDHTEAFAAQPRNIIVAGAGSRVKIAEYYIGISQNTYISNCVTEIFLGENSYAEHDTLQRENENSYHIGSTYVHMDAGAQYLSNAVTLGGCIVRNTITARFDAEGAECTLNGLSFGTGTQLIDNHTVIDHAKPHCNSHEIYKSILDAQAKGVFNGKIFVRRDAQKTDAKQTNKTLLLSDDASMNAKPQLEIFADDVKCTHGATIGQLDDEQLFYLRTRGIGLREARGILTAAFAGDVVGRITIDSLRQQIEQLVLTRLEQSRGAHKLEIEKP